MKETSIEIIIAFLVTLAVTPCYAQYKGENGRGDAKRQLLNSPLRLVETSVYKGGNGRGEAASRQLNLPMNAVESSVYQGNGGRGDASRHLINSPLTSIDAFIFKGGTGRGDAVLKVLNTPLQAVDNSVYKGNGGRGDAKAELKNAPLNIVESLVYKGGTGRGDARLGLVNIPLQVADGFIYRGGHGRGDVVGQLFNSTLSATLVCVNQHIGIVTGWNLISSYIKPIVPNMADVFSDIVADIILVKDNLGQAYIPSLNINSIGNWHIEQGYKVKASNITTLVMGCEPVDPAVTPIPLPVGWSAISYLRKTPMDISLALTGISDSVLIVKDGLGNSYIPSFSINTIGDMEPGQGYKLKMAGSVVLYYPGNLKISGPGTFQVLRQPKRYNGLCNTGHNATIIVPAESIGGIVAGDEVGVFSRRGMLVGAAVYEGGNFAITVWGNDPTTKSLDGLDSSEDFVFRIWRAIERTEFGTEVSYESGDVGYQDDGMSILKKLALKPKLEELVVLDIYPNPTEGALSIEYYLQQQDDVELCIFDLYGKEIVKHEFKSEQKGRHRIQLDLSKFTNGIYMCEFKSSDISRTVKVQKY